MRPRPNGARAGTATKDMLRFVVCGSVDDGKSTLIGRLLHDTKMIFEDQLAALAEDSVRHGTLGSAIDLSLIVDGLEAEREQGITIDVAYRFFTTPTRSFVVTDSPGHEQYTRNMATAASNAQLAIILIDARKGILTQTKRHSIICSLLGISRVILAINKIDLVGYQSAAFDHAVSEYAAFAQGLGFASIVPIPVSARFGDNVAELSDRTAWYQGRTLLNCLETAPCADESISGPLRLPVQWINRSSPDFRGYCGTVASGRVSRGQQVNVAVSGLSARIDRIVTFQGDVPEAEAGDAITVTFAHQTDVGRGDMLVDPASQPHVSDRFIAHVIWMDQKPLMLGRSYLMRIGTNAVSAAITAVVHKIDVDTGAPLEAATIGINEIGLCNISTAKQIAFDAYRENRKTGAFILIDRYSKRTAGAGMIDFAMRDAATVHWQSMSIGKTERASIKSQRPTVVWFTGLSGAGKSTIANEVEKMLFSHGVHTMLLDGDNLRHGISRDLGFTEADRIENIRRVGEIARLMVDAGLIVICSFISPYFAEREMVRNLVSDGEFIEVFVDTPIEECMRRDPKGLYAKVRRGTVKDFTGVDAPYEAPEAPEVWLRTLNTRAEDLAERVIETLIERRRIVFG